MRQHFHSVEACGVEYLEGLDKDRPVIAFANHSNWWDGLIIFYLTRFRRDKDFYCMMEEKQLLHYPFFRWLGAFSVDLQHPVRAAAAVRYACNLLKSAQNIVWIFPQGRMATVYEPIEIRKGTEFLASHTGNVSLLPVAFRYEFFREQRPKVLIRFGRPFNAGETTDERVRSELQKLTDELAVDCREERWTGYRRIMKPSLSVNKKWEWCRLLVTGRLSQFNPDN